MRHDDFVGVEAIGLLKARLERRTRRVELVEAGSSPGGVLGRVSFSGRATCPYPMPLPTV